MPLNSVSRATAVLVFSLMLGVSWLLPPPGHTEDAPVEVMLSTTPPQEHISPDGEAATVTLTVRLRGTPLTGGRLSLQMTAPPRSTVLSTDFPHVEGSALLALTSELHPNGTYAFQYTFPIRGVYTLALQIAPLPGGPVFRPTSLNKTIHVAENPAEVRNAWLFILGLFGFGLMVGGVLARSAAAREASQVSALVLLSLLAGGLLGVDQPAAVAQEHTHTSRTHAGVQVVQGAEGWELEVQPHPASATVGQLFEVAIVLKKDGQVWPHSLDVELAASNQEDGREVFHTTLRTQAGQPAPRLQLFDGAPHSLTVTAHPPETPGYTVTPLTTTMGLDVVALHPPMAVKLRLMALFVVVLVSGMVLGFFLPRPFKEPSSA